MARARPYRPRPSAAERERTREIHRRLLARFPDARIALHWASPLQLLVATILSAQSTDRTVNLVTPALFARYPTAAALAAAGQAELETVIRATGFFRNKARSIIGCCRALVERHRGEVPRTMAELTELPGVGRKTANVVLGGAFDVPGVVVDTHVGRVARRLALSRHDDPEKIERDLMARLPEESWISFSNAGIFLGRKICHARRPRHADCPAAGLCPTARSPDKGR